MRAFYVPSLNPPDVYRDTQIKGNVETYQFDASSWAADNAAVSDSTWTLRSGNASIGTPSESSNVASCEITFSEVGRQLIKVELETAGNAKTVVHLDVMVKEPYTLADDYGLHL